MGTKLITSVVIFAIFLAVQCDRLPKNVVPSNYQISLTVNPEDTTFIGTVAITFDATPSNKEKNVTEIKLHADPNFINISTITYNDTANICNVGNTTDDVVTITCSKDIQGTDQYLEVTYNGTLSTEDMYGLYKSTYTENKVVKTLVATQFEESYARRAFPCFDEPEFKATFDISLTYPKEYIAISNTNGTATVKGDLATTTFDTSPVMSTYLAAFVISQFESTGSADKGQNYTFSVYSRPDAVKYTDTAVTYGPQLIDSLGEYLGVTYDNLGNDKMDLIAIPDFAAGAMENWGLITYREIDLLDEAEQTTKSARQTIITVIAHELAHQWFGDYVTLGWWSETWLNEGFATYFEYHIAHLVDSDMELDKQFVVDVVLPVLQVDAEPSSDPLSSKDEDVLTTAQEDKKFGDISYSKGGSIVRMLRFILGEDNLKKGLQKYLTNFKYNNTKASDLLNTLQDFVPDKNLDLTVNMESWIYSSGFPLLNVSLSNNSVTIQSQKIFSTAENNATTTWYVPVSYTSSVKPDFENVSISWLEPGKNITTELSNSSWFIVNLQASGFYRVNYDAELWSRIIAALKDDKERSKIDVLNRALLVDDVFNIAKVDEVGYETAFSLAQYLVNETEYYPWISAVSAFYDLLNRINDSETLEGLQELLLHLLKNVLSVPSSAQPNSNLSHVDVLKQTLILKTACKLGHTECTNYVKNQFANYKKNASSLVDYNLRDVIFCNALRYSENASVDFDFLFNIYKNSESPNEKVSILKSLACANDSDVLYKYLLKTITEDSYIRKQDAATVFGAVYNSNPIGIDVAIDFLVNNSAEISDYYKGMSAVSTVVRGIASRITTDTQLDKLAKYIENNTDTNVKEIEDEVLLLAKNNKLWIDNHKDTLRDVILGASSTVTPSVTPKPNSSIKLSTHYFGVAICTFVAFLSFTSA